MCARLPTRRPVVTFEFENVPAATLAARSAALGIRYQEGVESQTAAQHIMADDQANRRAVALDSAPPASRRRPSA